jgi:hypothetical protein
VVVPPDGNVSALLSGGLMFLEIEEGYDASEQ